jgi:hypothetical protein
LRLLHAPDRISPWRALIGQLNWRSRNTCRKRPAWESLAPQGNGKARVVLAMGRRFWLIVASCTQLVVLAGCQMGPTSGSPGTPNRCTPQGARQVVERFIDAFNRGDTAQLDRLVSQQQFVWYATDAPGQRLNAEAYDREDLMAYFAARHRQHEHLVLNSLDVTFTNASRGGLVAYLTRSADDGLRPTRYSSKIEVQCSTPPSSLTVWAMTRSPWSPIELLPEAAALLLIAGGIGGIVLWRRRTGRLASTAKAEANSTR